MVDERVLEAMSDTRWGKRTNFTTSPNESARSAYRIIMLINGSTTSAYRICQYYPDRPFGPGSTRGEVKVVATYCRGESPLTQAIGKVDAAGPDDPEFRQFIRQMVANLLPSHNPQAREDRRRRVVLTVSALLACTSCASEQALLPFTTDGCSRFPDGTPAHSDQWKHCCPARGPAGGA